MAQRTKPQSGDAFISARALDSSAHAQRLRGMCNHGLISEERAQEVIERIQTGSQSVEDAIVELQEDCTCGLFIPSRARRILNAARADTA